MIYNCLLCNYNTNKKYNITRHNNIKHKNIKDESAIISIGDVEFIFLKK